MNRKAVYPLLLLMGIILISGCSQQAPASGGPGDILIADDGYMHGDPDISGNLLVWTGRSPTGEYLFLRDLSTNRNLEIRNRSKTSEYENVFGNAFISGTDILRNEVINDKRTVYLYDLTTGKETLLLRDWVFTPVDFDGIWLIGSSCQVRPHRVGSMEVWDLLCDLSGYHIPTGTTRMITNMTGFQGDASLDRGRVVFSAGDGGKYHVYLYDLSSGIQTRITTDPIGYTAPRLSGDHIGWMALQGNRTIISLYNISTGKMISLPNNLQNVYSLGISDNYVLWSGPAYEKGQALYVYSIPAGELSRVTGPEARPLDTFAISNSYVVWEDVREKKDQKDLYRIYAMALTRENMEPVNFGTG